MKLTRRGILGILAAAVLGRKAVAALEPRTASGPWLDSFVSGAPASNAPADWAANHVMWTMKTPEECLADVEPLGIWWDGAVLELNKKAAVIEAKA